MFVAQYDLGEIPFWDSLGLDLDSERLLDGYKNTISSRADRGLCASSGEQYRAKCILHVSTAT